VRPSPERVDVAVVGGGPAGAATAARLAQAGVDVLVIERQPAWRWRACGVFSSPVTLIELRRLGLSTAEVAEVARSVPRLWVESAASERFALTYGHRGEGDPTAIGFDRSRLDPLLLALAEQHGARVVRGTTFVGGERTASGGWSVRVRDAHGERRLHARILVGADGVGSVVGRTVGVTRPTFLHRVGLTFHVAADAGPDARMLVLPGAYCGLAPVPGGRINVGIVLASAARRRSLATRGARAVATAILREARFDGSPEALDAMAGISPLAHRVARRSGAGWLLIGDAAGFLDPFTGEGLHRALVSARLGASAIADALGGRSRALADYDAAMSRRFRGKDLVSWIVQGFVAQPRLFGYAAARIAARPALRARLGRVMGDLDPATDALDPRFLVALLRP
jgi:flavin-dependent dehydrogenase